MLANDRCAICTLVTILVGRMLQLVACDHDRSSIDRRVRVKRTVLMVTVGRIERFRWARRVRSVVGRMIAGLQGTAVGVQMARNVRMLVVGRLQDRRGLHSRIVCMMTVVIVGRLIRKVMMIVVWTVGMIAVRMATIAVVIVRTELIMI